MVGGGGLDPTGSE